LIFSSLGKKGLLMKYDMLEANKDYPTLRVVEALDNALFEDIQVDLEEERKALEEQARAEEFWAGRNLAKRNSTRRAA
jgi:hypothetical protein